jgi:hypothetical protein
MKMKMKTLMKVNGCSSRQLPLTHHSSSDILPIMSSSRSANTTIRRLATAIERPPGTTGTPPTARARGQGRYGTVRSNWLRREVQEIFDGPLMETVFKAAEVHRMHHDPSRIQLCTLMNIKSESGRSAAWRVVDSRLLAHPPSLVPTFLAGGCLEDCSYCSQSTHHKGTPTKATPLVKLDPVIQAARQAKENGSTRFCMGAAWRGLEGRERGFERILSMVREVRGMGMEGEFVTSRPRGGIMTVTEASSPPSLTIAHHISILGL